MACWARAASGPGQTPKSTLATQTTAMTVALARGTRVGYLSQDPKLDPEDTLRHAAARAFERLDLLHREMEELYEEMAKPGADVDALMKRQAKLEEAIERAGGYAIDHRIDETLHGLGFTDEQFSTPVSKMSGGQRARVGLARLLLELAAPHEGRLVVRERLTHQDIANRVGASREMVSRVMKDLEERGVIETLENGSVLLKNRLS